MGFENIDLEIDYENLIKDLVEGVPQLSKKWTDQNASDFGIMILELYAFIADNYLYKINRVDDDVLFKFLNNYMLESTDLMANPDNSANAQLHNTSLSDSNDYLLVNLAQVLAGQPTASENTLTQIRSYFSEPYRLITEQDVITICKNLIATFVNSRTRLLHVLKGIDVDHDFDKHSFSLVVSVALKDSNTQLTVQEKEDITKKLEMALQPRKLLGSIVKVAYAKQITVTSVYVKISLNTNTSEWNRDADKLIQDRVMEYFKNTARGGELSLYQVISLFELYSFLEELEAVDYVEEIVVKIDGWTLKDDPNDPNYKVMYEFAGDLIPPSISDITIKRNI
jgi:hypothetical protein